MKIFSILIVSSSEDDKAILKDQVSKLPFSCTCKFVTSLGEVIKELNREFPNALLIDTNIVSFDSIRTIFAAIPRESLPLIITSDKVNDAVESYNLGIPIDFILKPFQAGRIEMAIGRAILRPQFSMAAVHQDSIFLKIGRVFKKFLFDDIIYIEGYGIYSKVMTPRGKITINDSIMSLEEKLSPKKFVRVHKSYIINTSKVVTLKSGALEMEIGEVPVGAHYKSSIESFLQVLKKSNLRLKSFEMN